MIQLRRRIVALALAAFLAFAAVATTSLVLTLTRTADAGPGFTDTPPWIAPHAAWLRANAIADGYPDNTFRPDVAFVFTRDGLEVRSQAEVREAPSQGPLLGRRADTGGAVRVRG